MMEKVFCFGTQEMHALCETLCQLSANHVGAHRLLPHSGKPHGGCSVCPQCKGMSARKNSFNAVNSCCVEILGQLLLHFGIKPINNCSSIIALWTLPIGLESAWNPSPSSLFVKRTFSSLAARKVRGDRR
mmetsp:Transcript_8963/g.33063  ORF Transcript_8963/g.33063 Transcript_8963/m.33063 type:complete len:130 (-) Transcript_8963:2750-3139(-)